MFDPQIPHLASADVQRKYVKRDVNAALDGDRFTYTELKSYREPLPTMGFEALDGVSVQNGVPVYGGTDIEEWDGRPLILVHKDPAGKITGFIKKRTPGFGGKRGKSEDVMNDYGNYAAIPDQLPERLARMILVQKGYPIIENLEVESGRNGEVIEWRWLKQAALSANPPEGVPELYQEILARDGFREFLAKYDEDVPEVVIPQPKIKRGPGRPRQDGANQ